MVSSLTRRKRTGRFFDITTGSSLPFESYETEEDFKDQLRAETRAKRITFMVLVVIMALGLAWVYFSGVG